MPEVNVNLGDASYSIHILPGSLKESVISFSKMNFTNKALVVTDCNVRSLYGDAVIGALKSAGFSAEIVSVNPGEGAKSLQIAESLYTKAIEMGLDRKSPIIALGGGVVGDLAGFAAATYLRGVPFIQIPTTLLAQVDSSVGGKVGVNHHLGKNLIGAFYQPRMVIIDTDVLNTLPDRELYTGLAEVIKYGVIADRKLFDYLNMNYKLILNKHTDMMNEIITCSCRIKAGVVEKDERESGLRMILNFGHTIGHAIEASTGFNQYNHGEAVSIGSYGAALISYYLGMCSRHAVDEVHTVLTKFKLPITAKNVNSHDLVQYLTRDKKVIGGKINWILLNDIGKVTVRSDVPADIVYRVLQELCDK